MTSNGVGLSRARMPIWRREARESNRAPANARIIPMMLESTPPFFLDYSADNWKVTIPMVMSPAKMRF